MLMGFPYLHVLAARYEINVIKLSRYGYWMDGLTKTIGKRPFFRFFFIGNLLCTGPMLLVIIGVITLTPGPA